MVYRYIIFILENSLRHNSTILYLRKENYDIFTGMMLAIAFLLLVLIIVCVIKRNRGGKYAVHERELAAGRGDYGDEGGFHEYSQPLDTKSAGGRASLASSSHQDGKHPESDTDSMAEYGEGDTGW